jgi:hypothetical protein
VAILARQSTTVTVCGNMGVRSLLHTDTAGPLVSIGHTGPTHGAARVIRKTKPEILEKKKRI